MKKSLALLISMTLGLSMLAGCGSKDAGNSQPTTAAQGGSTAAGGQQSQATGTVNPEDQHFRTYLSADPTTLDISLRSDTYSSSIMTNNMEGLVRLEDQNGEYVMCPGDAETWESNDDGTVWTFHLNPNAKWEDGEPVTAQQYVYSLQRSAAPETGCPNSFFLEPLLNFSEVNSGAKDVSELGVKAVDDHTLEITLKAAMPSFIQMCSGTLYYPQRQDKIEEYGEKYGSEAQYTISNGPFRLESWVHNNSIVLVKNENYWDAENVTLQKVTFNIMEDENSYYNAFESGELDYVSTGSAEWLQRFQSRNDTEYMSYTSATLVYGFYNNEDELFQNANIRKAFTLSIDREELNQMCFSGLRVPTYGWVVPTISVGDTNFREAAGDVIKEMKEELTAQGKTAKDLLIQGMEELGLGNDPSALKVTFSLAGTSDWYRTLGDYLQQSYLKELGVNVEISFSDWGIFYDSVQKGDYQIGFMSWGAYYNDPYDVLSLFVSTTDAIETGWSSEAYDELIAKAAVEMDDAKRLQMYIEAENMILREDCVVSPFATSQVNVFIRDYVKNYPSMGFSNRGLKDVVIQK